LLVLSSAPLLHAANDAAEAKRRFGEGTKALEAGRFREAALHFEAAARLRPHPVASYTAAVAWDKAEDPARAADNFARALDMPGLPAKEHKVAEERLTSLEESLGTAKITGPSTITVQFEGSTEATPPARLHSTPGARVLVIVRDEKIERRDVILKVGQTVEVDVTEEAAPPPPAPTASAPPPPPTASAEPDEPPPSPPGDTRKYIGYGLTGLGVVSAGVAIGLGFKTLSARDDYEANPTRAGYDSATSSRTWTNVAWAGAAVFGGVGLALVLWPSGKPAEGEKTEETARIRISPSFGGVQIGGTF
jgi:hypothetical protein